MLSRISQLSATNLRTAAVVITALVFGPLLFNGFTTWDDPNYVYNNPTVTGFASEGWSWSNLFSDRSMGILHPVTWLSLGIDHWLWELEPFGYHLTSWLLHLFNVFLVFQLLRRWTASAVEAAFGALLFGIHPMHLEAVAWISSRKDLLMGTFVLLGLLQYHNYRDRESLKSYLLSLLFFGLACLSKPTAMVFPAFLLLVDFWQKRAHSIRLWLDKLPFVAGSVAMLWITLDTQKATGALNQADIIPWWHGIVIGARNLVVYLFDFFVPVRVSPYHPYAELDPTVMPSHFYLFLGLFVLVLFGVIYSLRYQRWLAFSLTWMVVGLIPVLQLLPQGSAITADRYTYLPYIGLSFGLIVLVRTLGNQPLARWVPGLAMGTLVVFSGFSVYFSGIWKDTYALWDRVVEHYPNHFYAYLNRGYAYHLDKNHTEALVDLNLAIQKNPRYYQGYDYRARVFLSLDNPEAAIQDFTKGLQLNPKQIDLLLDRALAFSQLNLQREALADFNAYIELDPDFPYAYFWRAVVWERLGQPANAIADYNQGLQLAPQNPEVLNNRAWVYYNVGETK
ncbi:MAG: tetratricopeptide repeat protein, partial [Salibacteraceae bacterium]